MLSKAQIKLIKSLHNKKFRKETGLFIAEGKKIVEEIAASAIKVQHIWATDRYTGTLEHHKITEEEMVQVSALTTPQGIIALCKIPESVGPFPKLDNEWAIALDDMRDPGNLGTIIRIADWFGINNVFCSGESVDTYNPKTVQATMGSIARVKVYYSELDDLLSKYRIEGIPIYGATMEGESMYELEIGKKGILVIGNEANGISERVERNLTGKISIPSFAKNKGPESLNAAVATAVLCAEIRRQGNNGK